jgi:lysyl-tRNA synthetase class 2
MKRLLAAGCDRIFQIGPCFRAAESGPLHNPEFTMLEWYCAGAGYRDILEDARGLMRRVAAEVLEGRAPEHGDARLDLSAPWTVIKVEDAFLKWAGWNPVRNFDRDRFDVDLVERVEPALPKDRPAVLMDYPAATAALARCREDDPSIAERWELYAGGVELANAFGELTDAVEQRRRFEECRQERLASGKPDHPMDEAFLEALASGLPACAGAALGVDRLVMLLAGETNIKSVRLFCEE